MPTFDSFPSKLMSRPSGHLTDCICRVSKFKCICKPNCSHQTNYMKIKLVTVCYSNILKNVTPCLSVSSHWAKQWNPQQLMLYSFSLLCSNIKVNACQCASKIVETSIQGCLGGLKRVAAQSLGTPCRYNFECVPLSYASFESIP